MAELSRRERFLKAKENRVNQQQGNFGGYERRDPVEYVDLQVVKEELKAGKKVLTGAPLQLRFVGGLEESNPRMPGDMKRISMADIKYFEKVETLDDLIQAQETKTPRKYMQLLFPDRSERREHPLWRLVDAVLSYDYDEVKKERDYHHTDDELFPLFKELRYNGDSKNNMESGWQPSDVYLMNCISRDHMDWHRENKKTLVLSRGSWIGKDKEGNEVKRFNTGCKKTVYDGLANELTDTYGFHEDYDVLVWRLADKPYYRIVNAANGFEAPFWARCGYTRKDEYMNAELTKEELSWELWDFDKFFQPTSCTRVLNKLGYMFKIYDEMVSTDKKKSNLYGELKALADKEKEERAARMQNQVAADGVTPSDEEDEDDTVVEETSVPVAKTTLVSTPAPTTPTGTSRRSVEPSTDVSGIPWAALADGTYNGIHYLGVPKMSVEEKAQVLSVEPDGSFRYVETYQGKPNPVGTCQDSGFKSPTNFKVDPKSGLEFED